VGEMFLHNNYGTFMLLDEDFQHMLNISWFSNYFKILLGFNWCLDKQRHV